MLTIFQRAVGVSPTVRDCQHGLLSAFRFLDFHPTFFMQPNHLETLDDLLAQAQDYAIYSMRN
ncbi:MAG: hypothetical protein ABIP71_10355, partial [Verrucomicrobiota bacterium]